MRLIYLVSIFIHNLIITFIIFIYFIYECSIYSFVSVFNFHDNWENSSYKICLKIPQEIK